MPKVSVVLLVLAPTVFLRNLTEFAIKTLREHADDKDFELIVVEAREPYFKDRCNELGIQKYISFNPPIGGVKELNAGVRAASGEYIVFTGNDVIVPPHWDTYLLEPFQTRKDCGISSLSAAEPGAYIGPPQWPQDQPFIVEGMYSPFVMFKRGWEYDEHYERIYQDSDLVMRMYEAGLRAYRNCRGLVHHMMRMTNDRVDTEEHNKMVGKDERKFYDRWHGSPLMMYALIRAGQLRYGYEHESLLAKINLHYDPNQPA